MESYIKGGRFSDSEWSRILKRRFSDSEWSRILRGGLVILKESYIKGGRFSDSEWSRILKTGGLVILNGVVY